MRLTRGRPRSELYTRIPLFQSKKKGVKQTSLSFSRENFVRVKFVVSHAISFLHSLVHFCYTLKSTQSFKTFVHSYHRLFLDEVFLGRGVSACKQELSKISIEQLQFIKKC